MGVASGNTHRVAINDRRILGLEGDLVRFGYRDRHGGGHRVMSLEGIEFLRRFLLHVLPTGFVRVRYFGLLGNRVRHDNLARCRDLLAAAPGEAHARAAPASPPPRDEARDEPRCPSCSTGHLRCVGVLARVEMVDPIAPAPRDTS